MDASDHRRVVNGKIEVPDEEFAEGMVVTILAPEERGTFTLRPEGEAALLASIREADRGKVIAGEELLRELRRDSQRLPLQVTRRALNEQES